MAVTVVIPRLVSRWQWNRDEADEEWKSICSSSFSIIFVIGSSFMPVVFLSWLWSIFQLFFESRLVLGLRIVGDLSISEKKKKKGNWRVKKHVLGRDSEFTMQPRPRNRSNDRNSRGEISLRFEIRLESNREILFHDWETICTSMRWLRTYVCFYRIANYNLRCFNLRIAESLPIVDRLFIKILWNFRDRLEIN